MCDKPHAQMKLLAKKLPVFDQDIWLYMCLKQYISSSAFLRFLFVFTMHEKNPIFSVLFVWFVWLLSKYKNGLFLILSRFALLILDLSSEAATRGVL